MFKYILLPQEKTLTQKSINRLLSYFSDHDEFLIDQKYIEFINKDSFSTLNILNINLNKEDVSSLKSKFNLNKDSLIFGDLDFFRKENKNINIVYYFENSNQNINLNKCIFFDKLEGELQNISIYLIPPYKPDTFKIGYDDDQYTEYAKKIMVEESLDENMPNGVVIEKNGKIIVTAANGSDFHKKREEEMLKKDPNYAFKGCIRKELGIPTGQRYDLCPGCSNENHGEYKAISKIIGIDDYNLLKGAKLHLYGHWWCCSTCCGLMTEANISEAILSKSWTKNYFNL